MARHKEKWQYMLCEKCGKPDARHKEGTMELLRCGCWTKEQLEQERIDNEEWDNIRDYEDEDQ